MGLEKEVAPSSRNIGKEVFKDIVKMSSELDPTQLEKAYEGIQKINSHFYSDIGTSAEEIRDDLLDAYPEDEERINAFISEDENDFGGVYVSVLETGLKEDFGGYGRPLLFGFYKDYIFPLSSTYALQEGIWQAQNESDSLIDRFGIDEENNEKYQDPLPDRAKQAVHNIKQIQSYMLEKAPRSILSDIKGATHFFDAFVKKDRLKNIKTSSQMLLEGLR